MSGTMLTFDIGDSYIKIAVHDKSKIKVYAKQMPENLVKDGVIQMPKMFSDFLKEVRKEFKLPKGECGLVVPDELCVCRTLTLPAMTEEQLEVNLPFEFSDFITGKPQRYVYDYAMQEMIYDEETNQPKEMILTGAVMSKEVVYGYIDMFRDAGLKLKTIIPQEIAVKNVMRKAVTEGRANMEEEYCLVNLGHRTTQVYIFKGDKLSVLRNIYIGEAAIDKAISENEMVDEFVARTYKSKNFNGVLDEEYSKDIYSKIAVEVMKVINFYRFNNRESELANIYFFGGGSNIAELCVDIADINDLHEESILQLLPKGVERQTDMIGLYAMGVLMQ